MYTIFDIPVQIIHIYLYTYSVFIREITRIEKLCQKVLIFKNLSDIANDCNNHTPSNHIENLASIFTEKSQIHLEFVLE